MPTSDNRQRTRTAFQALPSVGTTSRRYAWRMGGLGLTFGAVIIALAGCAEDGPSVLDPGGPRAATIEDLWWVLFGLAAVVFTLVIALLGIGLYRSWRRSVTDSRLPAGSGIPFVAAGVTMAAIVTIIVLGFTLRALAALADPDEPAAVTIEVVGNQWWWDIRYPEEDVVTANEVHIPVGEPVRLELTADDVIHSFWVPELSGKMDLIPGRVNTLWLEASEPGVYRGQCAEFCGIQHAHMAFLVIADDPEAFTTWLDEQRQPAAAAAGPLVERGQDLFLTAGCMACHTVRGTAADGEVGPDLTHLASRSTLAAGTLEFNFGNLSGWVADPQGIKPGANMPNISLTADELAALVAYLLSLT